MDQRQMISNHDTQNNFVFNLDAVVHYFNLYQQPIPGMELYFANSILLVDSWEAMKQKQQDTTSGQVIQNYIGNSNPEQIDIGQETESNNLIDLPWLDIQAGMNNHFSIREMDDEMRCGFLGHVKDGVYVNDQKYHDLSPTEQAFLEQAYLLITGQKTCQNIDPEWFNFQVNNSINFLNTVASVHHFGSKTEVLFQDVLNHIETYYGKSTVQSHLFCSSKYIDIQISELSQETIDWLEQIHFDQSVIGNLFKHKSQYLSCVFKSLDTLLDYIEPQDLFESMEDSCQFGTIEKLSMLECFIKKIKHFKMVNSTKQNPIRTHFLDHLTEKLCQSQTTIDYFKQFNQKPTNDSKEQQIKDYIHNKMQNLILNQDLNQEQTPVNKINKKR